jgi:hypothetical protein
VGGAEKFDRCDSPLRRFPQPLGSVRPFNSEPPHAGLAALEAKHGKTLRWFHRIHDIMMPRLQGEDHAKRFDDGRGPVGNDPA